ncbi:MAG: hypothetical protein GX825_10125, partial [Syntrophomonadaceae bacterium]|nr:hypothetical protein [Syntrophomonadaceae bacterium]
DMLHLENDLKKLEEAKIDYLHFDVMDGHFVPNLMLPMEMINKVRKGTKLPFDIHLMTEKPENIIPNTGNGKSLSVFVFIVVSISFTTNYPSKSIGTRMAVGRPTDII